jgi:hypothetical protein
MITGKRGVSLPFSDYCEPVATDKDHFPAIFDKIIKHGDQSGWKYLECRGGKDFLKNNCHSLFFFSHDIDLNRSTQNIYSEFRNSTKRNIKKAVEKGVEVSLYQSMASVKEFYQLNFLTRKKHGLPPQPSFFFRKIFEHIIAESLGFVALAKYQNKIIAGAIFFHIGEKAIYKFSAFDRNFQSLRPNNLVIWEAIKWYSTHGFKSFCFGITEPENKGLRQFKLGWGVNEKIIHYYKYDLQKQSFIKDHFRSRVSYNFFRNLPAPLLNLTGILLYRHVG